MVDPTAESYRSFTDDGAWCWFSDPRAVYYQGRFSRTYAGWVDSTGSVTVGYYDHTSGETVTQVVHKNLERDDHDNPALLIDRQGRLVIFYSKHAGKEPLYLARSQHPEDISTWEPARKLPLNDTLMYTGMSDTYTYANICRLSEEADKLYLFWRGADFKPNFSVSTDHGETWSAGRIMILPERSYANRRPYLKVATNDKDIIHFAFTDGHPNAEPENSIYYLKYQDGSFQKADGAHVADWSALPVDPRQCDVVYDATVTGEKAWVWDVAGDENGNPVIAYVRFPNDTAHVYYYCTWNEGAWQHHRLVNSGSWFPQTPAGVRETEPNYSGGLALDHNDPSIVYLSRQKNGKFEIERWQTPDHGKTWNVKAITTNSKHDNVRPFVVRSYHKSDSLNVLWMSFSKYVHWTNYNSAIKMNIHY